MIAERSSATRIKLKKISVQTRKILHNALIFYKFVLVLILNFFYCQDAKTQMAENFN